MGLFDFIRNAGVNEDLEKTEKVSPERLDQLRKEAISKSIAELDIQGEQVSVAVEGSVATLTGTAPSQEALEKMVLCAGNQYGISNVDCQLSVEAGDASGGAGQTAGDKSATAGAQFYTVKSGDTLSGIARQFYGAASKYPLIFAANQPMLKDPDHIYPGQTLRIPPA